jgi:hypothetical protein
MPRKFSFLSPGVQINEIDESFLPAEAEDAGIMIIGTAPKGPGLEPVSVPDLATFNEVFGAPVVAGSSGGDVWREGSTSATSYGMVAAELHFNTGVGTPVKFVRLVGEKDSSVSSDDYSAGWNLGEAGNISTSISDNITAYGIWVMNSGSIDGLSTTHSHTGSLAAIFYVSGAALTLNGTVNGIHGTGSAALTSSAGSFINCGTGNTYNILIHSTDAAVSDNLTSDFKSREAVQIFNTNPEQLKASSNFGNSSKLYFLGETFELETSTYTTNTGAGKQSAIALPLQSAGGFNWSDHKRDSTYPKTGWFIDRRPNQTKLFRLVSLHRGESFQNEYYPTIESLRLGTDNLDPSTFKVCVYKFSDPSSPVFSAVCSLLPEREDFIGKMIGDQFQTWNSSQKKYDLRGSYAVTNNYVRVELADDIANGTLNDPLALPVGFYGPAKPKPIVITASDTGAASLSSNAFTVNPSGVPIGTNFSTAATFATGSAIKLPWPTLKLSTNATAYQADSFMGVDHSSQPNGQLSPCYADIVRALPANNANAIDEHANSLNALLEYSFVFSMEDVRKVNGYFFYESGSYNANGSVASSGSVQDLFDDNIRKYRANFHGGFDGLDIKNSYPFANTILSGKSETTSYAYNSIKKALSTIEDPEITQFDLLAVPGLTNTSLTDDISNLAKKRQDCLYIMDLPDIYLPKYENSGTESFGTLNTIVSTFKNRKVDSSYSATSYPWARYNSYGLIPPSVAAVEAISKSEALSQPWFAPAGFNRGTINASSTSEHLTKANRDSLYEARINPIARFPASNQIVAFGQKTLQRRPSALDRINVRRLLIYLKREIGVIADQLLFDQNVDSTWQRFRTQAEAVLNNVKTNLGITEYKLVLDETTTTADLVDRNIMYAKILIKPARAIEFIVVDFVITRSGVEF